MTSSDIYELFREIASDDRFRDHLGLALGRGVVDDVLVYEIRITDFDFDQVGLDVLQAIAEREGLIFQAGSGSAVLRQCPAGSGSSDSSMDRQS